MHDHLANNYEYCLGKLSAYLPIKKSMDGTISPLQEEQQIQRWFLGLEQTAKRQISVEEAGALKKRISRLKMRPLWILVMAILSIPLFILFLKSLNLQSDIPDALFAILAISLILIGLPVYILFTRDSFSEAKALKGDLETGSIFIFEGPVTQPLRRCKTIRHLTRERLIHVEENIPHRFDVLLNSETVLRVNGVISGRWRKGRIVEATAAPEQHYDALVKQGLSEGAPGESVDLFQRHMSQAELGELKHHIARFKKPPALLIAMTVWMLMLITTVFISMTEGGFGQWQNKYRFQAVMVCILFAITTWRYIRALKTARLMNQDAGMEILRIIKSQEECAGNTNKDLIPVLEFLPVSLLGWSVDGKPYPWRLRKPRLLKT
jgi:hypothetical protein